MRTTVRIDDDLMSDLKQLAESHNLSFTRIINRVLRLGLQAAAQPSPQRQFRQKTFTMGEASVDVTKALTLANELEDEELIRKMTLRK